MDFKREEYRKQKQQKANVTKPQKKKEIRLRVSHRRCLFLHHGATDFCRFRGRNYAAATRYYMQWEKTLGVERSATVMLTGSLSHCVPFFTGKKTTRDKCNLADGVHVFVVHPLFFCVYSTGAHSLCPRIWVLCSSSCIQA